MKQATIDFSHFEQDLDEEPEKTLKRVIHGFAHVGRMKNLNSIVHRELLEGGENLPDSFAEAYDQALSLATSALEAIKKKEGYKDINPFLVTWMLFSFFVHWEIALPYLRRYDDGKWDKIINDINGGITKEMEEIVFRIISKKDD